MIDDGLEEKKGGGDTYLMEIEKDDISLPDLRKKILSEEILDSDPEWDYVLDKTLITKSTEAKSKVTVFPLKEGDKEKKRIVMIRPRKARSSASKNTKKELAEARREVMAKSIEIVNEKLNGIR